MNFPRRTFIGVRGAVDYRRIFPNDSDDGDESEVRGIGAFVFGWGGR